MALDERHFLFNHHLIHHNPSLLPGIRMPLRQDALVLHLHADIFPLLAGGAESSLDATEALHLVRSVEDGQLGLLPVAELFAIRREAHPHALVRYQPVFVLVAESHLHHVHLGRDGQLDGGRHVDTLEA